MDFYYHPNTNKNYRPLKNYFSEFLIVFLAVILVFFVENLREYFADKAKTKEYAQSLYNDLKADTVNIQLIYDEGEWIKAKYDSAENILASPDLLKYNEFIYYIDKYLVYNNVFISEDLTFQQLRGSGNFRYIKSVSILKKITYYYNLCQQYESVYGSFDPVERRNDLVEMETKLFNQHDLTSLNNDTSTIFYTRVKRPGQKLKPLYRDYEYLKLFYAKINHAEEKTGSSGKFLLCLKNSAFDLMKDLKKEYNLK